MEKLLKAIGKEKKSYKIKDTKEIELCLISLLYDLNYIEDAKI